jgi:hypothetical protein
VSVFDTLIASGAIGSLKRDIVVEASDDIYYLAHIRKWFEEASQDSAKAATACTVRLVRELVAKGLCRLATWGEDKGSIKMVNMSEDELTKLVEKYQAVTTFPFDYFLTATKTGDEWVARYKALLAEL